MNTLCPKIGAAQWTCSYKECNCHLKGGIKRKLLFLDVDGVLNNDTTYARGHRIGRYHGLDPALVKLFLDWWIPTKVEIILSSSWRFRDDFKAALRSAGILFKDETPSGRGVRGEEIQAVLSHYRSADFAILDDNSDMLPHHMSHLVQTDPTRGLRPRDLIHLNKILKL